MKERPYALVCIEGSWRSGPERFLSQEKNASSKRIIAEHHCSISLLSLEHSIWTVHHTHDLNRQTDLIEVL
jgi:hypothetical protein